MKNFILGVQVLIVCGFSMFVQADTVFQSGSVNTAANWDNGLPNVANGNGIIGSNGTFLSQLYLAEGTFGTVTVTHTNGTLTASSSDWNIHNNGGNADYSWNQTGGNVVLRLLHPNIHVTYTLSGSGMITGNASDASVFPFNSGVFRQTGGTLANMGINIAYGTTVELSGGVITNCGVYASSQVLWAHTSSAAKIHISGDHTITFSSSVSATNVVLLTDSAQLVFDLLWTGRWVRDNFSAADWVTVLTDTGTKVGTLQVTAGNFNDLFVVTSAGAAGSCVQIVTPDPIIAEFPTVTSAALSFHLNAGDMNNDDGATDPGDGNDITQWLDLNSGVGVNIQGTPSWHDAALAGNPAVRFVDAESDLIYCNNAPINIVTAQTIFAVASMVEDTNVYSDLISNGSGSNTIRQDAENAAYFTGNTTDFIYGGGSHAINGTPRFDIPGGFGSAHVVKVVSASQKTYSSLRIGDNTNNRRWSGDVAELIIYDSVLDANDTAYVNRYLNYKYGIAQVVDERITDTSQVADEPFTNADLRQVGVNFYYAPSGDTIGTLHGISFDNINLAGSTPPSGPFTLTANSPDTTLTLNFPFTKDNTPRFQYTVVTGTNAATLNTVANEFFYLSPGGDHPTAMMTFAGLGFSREVYVQVFGGDAGWSGDIDVTANGSSVKTWMSVADGNNATTSMFCFLTSTDITGGLELLFTGVTHFSGIGGLILTEKGPPPTLEGTVIIIY